MWISFDLDGTILDWPFGQVVFKPLRDSHGTPELHEAFRLEFRNRFAGSAPVSAFDWDDIHQQITAQLEHAPLPRILELAEQGDWTRTELIYPDTKPALEQLEKMGYKSVVGTNGLAQYQRVALEKLGISVPHVIAPDTVGFVKPQAEFLTTFHTLEPDGVIGVHVGDLLAQDVMSANRAKVTAVWIWRDMPTDLRAIPVSDRPRDAAMQAAVQRTFEHELERDGRFGAAYEHTPRPDIIVADLLELTGVLPDLTLEAGMAPSPRR